MVQLAITDVLLVEDNPADIYLVQRALQDCGSHLRLWLVSRGSDALAFLRHEPPFRNVPAPALIFLDLHLPGRSSQDILRELRCLPAYQTTPAVILSGAE